MEIVILGETEESTYIIMNSFCSVTSIGHKTIMKRGCPHCLLDLHPEQGPLPKHTGQYIYMYNILLRNILRLF